MMKSAFRLFHPFQQVFFLMISLEIVQYFPEFLLKSSFTMTLFLIPDASDHAIGFGLLRSGRDQTCLTPLEGPHFSTD